ncbi:MAG: hypothetical protein WB561_14015 [Terracidiphilus sp.]
MNHQAYASTYRSAMDAATVELDGLFEEVKRLRNRMEQIDSAINALKPLLAEGQTASEAQSAAAYSEIIPMKQQIDSALAFA